MEPNNLTVVGGDEEQQQHLIPPLSSLSVPPVPPLSVPAVPPLSEGEIYNVFISYSSTDSCWAHCLVDRLESYGLNVCYHERDFIPGRNILENMSDCIQESQKVLLVLSQEFVKSRWCLLEANMSLFRDCLKGKHIVPVLMEPGVEVPLHLSHLTYLEPRDPEFLRKLLKVLCIPNQQLQGSSVVPFQPPSIYNGKALQPLSAVNEEGIHPWQAGQFSDMGVPDQLRLVIQDEAKYCMAIRSINSVSKTNVWSPEWFRYVLVVFTLALFAIVIFLNCFDIDGLYRVSVLFLFTMPLGVVINICRWANDNKIYMICEMQKAVGQANILLLEENILMGCCSGTKLYVVYVSKDSCRREFADTFHDQSCAEEMFERALLFFSSGYTCCLSKRHFPFPQPSSNSHLEGGVCFCQYVSQQLSRGEWS